MTITTKYHGDGDTTVHLDAAAVDAFKAQWPCHGLPENLAITFTFDSEGSLVDIHALVDGRHVDSAEFDGPALLALSHDAQGEFEIA